MSNKVMSSTPACSHCSMPYGNNKPIIMDAFERGRLRDAMDNDILNSTASENEAGSTGTGKQIVSPESPFLAIRSLLRAFQLLGVFNFSFDDDCSVFRCRPCWLLYSLFLNLATIGCFAFVVLSFVYERGLTFEEVVDNINMVFSHTDIVAILGFFFVLELSALGLQINNMGLCFHLNTLTVSMKELSIISGIRTTVTANPGFWKQGMAFTGLMVMKIVAVSMIGFCFPSSIDLSPSLPLRPKILVAIFEAIAIVYLHLPQFLSEVLFVRVVDVLEHQYEYLLDHIECCLTHKISKSNLDMRGKMDIDCCVMRCKSLFILFKGIEETFCKQLVINFTLVMGCLVFGVYLSITFLISGGNANGFTRDTVLSIIYPLGYSIYSLVPVTRLFHTTTVVDRVMKKIDAVKRRLFSMEAMAAEDKQTTAKIRCVLRSYTMVDGFSACNYFTVNRGLVTSIAGYLVTYIIVLVQFKVSDINK